MILRAGEHEGHVGSGLLNTRVTWAQGSWVLSKSGTAANQGEEDELMLGEQRGPERREAGISQAASREVEPPEWAAVTEQARGELLEVVEAQRRREDLQPDDVPVGSDVPAKGADESLSGPQPVGVSQATVARVAAGKCWRHGRVAAHEMRALEDDCVRASRLPPAEWKHVKHPSHRMQRDDAEPVHVDAYDPAFVGSHHGKGRAGR